MRHAHFFWRAMIVVAGSLVAAWAWRFGVAAAWQWSQPAIGAGQLSAEQTRAWVELRTLWVPGAFVALWAGYWLGGLAWFGWWLICLRLAWDVAGNALQTLGGTPKQPGQAPTGDLAGAWLLVLMPIAAGLLGAVLGRRAFEQIPPPPKRYVAPPMPDPAATADSADDTASLKPIPDRRRQRGFKRRDDAYR